MKYFIYGYPPTYTYTIKITPSIDKRLEFMGIVCIRISSEYTYVNMIIYEIWKKSWKIWEIWDKARMISGFIGEFGDLMIQLMFTGYLPTILSFHISYINCSFLGHDPEPYLWRGRPHWFRGLSRERRQGDVQILPDLPHSHGGYPHSWMAYNGKSMEIL